MSDEVSPPAGSDGALDGAYTLFRYTGLADVHCPLCRDAGREVTMGFLHWRYTTQTLRIRAAEPTVLPDDDDGLPKMAGRFLTDSPRAETYLDCPHPDCGRRQGPYTARSLFRRLRKRLPLTVR